MTAAHSDARGQPPKVRRWIDLNADLGEGVTDDPGLLGVVTSANVACGGHAGDRATMREVCAQAAERGVTVGAQVSYVDREHFGRQPLDVAYAVLREQLEEQYAELVEAATAAGIAVAYVKPHGALYHRAAVDAEQAQAVLDAVPDLPVLGLPGALIGQLAIAGGRRGITEGFPDRGYRVDGSLVPRGEAGALVEDPAEIAGHAVRLAARVESVCVHGDSPGAVGAARQVRLALVRAGWELRSTIPG